MIQIMSLMSKISLNLYMLISSFTYQEYITEYGNLIITYLGGLSTPYFGEGTGLDTGIMGGKLRFGLGRTLLLK